MQPGAGALAGLDRMLTGLRLLPGGPRWSDPSSWHITLVFLGEVAESRVDAVAAEIGPAVAAGRPLRLRLAGAGTFPARGAPRVLWAGVTGAGRSTAGAGRSTTSDATDGVPSDAAGGVTGDATSDATDDVTDDVTDSVTGGEVERLGRLARAVRRAARAAGVPVERRPYQPHLTLGRWRPADPADRAVADPLTGYAGAPFDVTELVLVRSHLGPEPRYEHLLAWPLGAAG